MSMKIRYAILGNKALLKTKAYKPLEENNLQKIITTIKSSFNASDIQLYDDVQQAIVFKNDKEVLDYFAKGRILYCKVLQKINDKSFISVQSNAKSEPQEVAQKDREMYFGKVKQIQFIKEEVKSEPKELVSNMKKVIQELLKKNVAQITSQINYNSSINSNKTFNILCSLCRQPAEGTIFACELNLKVISCKQCSSYLKYQLPFPFKPYTDPSLYQKQRDQQPKSAEVAFKDQMQKERSSRNDKISDRLQSLPIFND